MSAVRQIAGPFAVAPPAGARVRTRLRVCGGDAGVLREVGGYLGSLASADLAARCAEGSLDAGQRARSRRARKRELTAKSSSRWAGALTRTSEDAYQLACRNLLAERLPLAGLPAGTRDGRLRAAITRILATARQHRAGAVVIENLDFAAARDQGREHAGHRPCRGRRGRAFRRQVAGLPTARFRDRLTGMASNAGIAVLAVDPAYTSRWAAQHWLAALRRHHPELTGHHAAALVIGRRGLGLRARRRASGNLPAPEDAARSTQARPGTHPKTGTRTRRPATRTDPRQPPGTKTARPRRNTAGDQATQDRPGPPARQDPLLPGDQER